MSMYKHQCIKPSCSNSYEDKDPDAYYCESCREHNKKLAQEVEAKLPKRKPHKSLLQQYDEAQKVNGFQRVRL